MRPWFLLSFFALSHHLMQIEGDCWPRQWLWRFYLHHVVHRHKDLNKVLYNQDFWAWCQVCGSIHDLIVSSHRWFWLTHKFTQFHCCNLLVVSCRPSPLKCCWDKCPWCPSVEFCILWGTVLKRNLSCTWRFGKGAEGVATRGNSQTDKELGVG